MLSHRRVKNDQAEDACARAKNDAGQPVEAVTTRKPPSRGARLRAVQWLAALVCAGAFAPAQAGSKLQNARDYVLAACISHAYASQPIAGESERWAQGLVEFGTLPASTYKSLAELARKAPPPKSSQSGTPMLLQNCVDWYNSAALRAQIHKVLASGRGK
jgi:hypothetical protein